MVQSVATDVKTPVDLATVSYSTSKPCVTCHPNRYATWHRTFHRTMTQRAGPGAVVGNFESQSLTFQNVTSRFTREGDRFFIETLSPAGAMERYEVTMTVGSRRIQQYLTRIGDRHVRLPLAWNIEEKRWIHLNGGFLHPDGSGFNTHRVEWDYNCIFCHNVKAQPRLDEASNTFDARVAELGIACEACHGPGELHVHRNSDPLRRYWLYLGGRDPTIHSPKEMTPKRQIQLCGHCHGQRLPNPPQRIAEFLIAGDPYTAGDDLSRITTPLDIHSELPGVDLKLRFWKDGTPRLTAYEYQGVLMSRGHETSKLTCISCHDAHGGDPRGMIQPAMRGNQACLQCHAGIARDVRAHTHHDPKGSGSDCYGCHMPPITYGLLAIHPSHRITNPEPARAWRYEMPEACTLCHTDRTAVWAATEAQRQYPKIAHSEPPADPVFRYAESVRALLAGDVVQRAVAVNALVQERSYTRDGFARMWPVPFLLLAMEDRYPAVRHFAWRGLLALYDRAGAMPGARGLGGLPEFDYLADEATRTKTLAGLWRWWGAFDKSRVPHPGRAVPLDSNLMPIPAEVAALRAKQEQNVIAIGE
jgi:predicted CXXCH cytochrome family protein